MLKIWKVEIQFSLAGAYSITWSACKQAYLVDYNGRYVANFQICVRAKLLARTKKAKLLQLSSEKSDFLAVVVKLNHFSELEFKSNIF